MKVKTLIKKLEKCDPNYDVVISDGITQVYHHKIIQVAQIHKLKKVSFPMQGVWSKDCEV